MTRWMFACACAVSALVPGLAPAGVGRLARPADTTGIAVCDTLGFRHPRAERTLASQRPHTRNQYYGN